MTRVPVAVSVRFLGERTAARAEEAAGRGAKRPPGRLDEAHGDRRTVHAVVGDVYVIAVATHTPRNTFR